jgi:cytochrome c peroxidase
MRSNKVIGGGKSESNKASELRKFGIYILFFSLFGISSLIPEESYQAQYISSIKSLISRQQDLLDDLRNNEIREPEVKDKILSEIHECRILLKKADFWIRYLEPTVYKKINGPLPVEWETEVFEKFERPYKREGAGLTLAEQYLDEDFISKDHLIRLIQESVLSSQVYLQDSITRFLKSHHHFFLANRLFLLNLAAIYTTGFECPNSDRVIPELRIMLSSVSKIYRNYNRNYPHYPLTQNYIDQFSKMQTFVENQDEFPANFNHYFFIRDHVNTLFGLNQAYIRSYKITTDNFNDYSLNNNANSIFDKHLYVGQDIKGVYRSISDENILLEIKNLGEKLFYDPLLSGNNLRSCASCHIPQEFFTDTSITTALQFDRKNRLSRNTPSLINSEFNHLLMMDGKHYNFPRQMQDVITNPIELNNQEAVRSTRRV